MSPAALQSAQRIAGLYAAERGLPVVLADRRGNEAITYWDDASEQGGAVVMQGRTVLAWISELGAAHVVDPASLPAASTQEAAPLASAAE